VGNVNETVKGQQIVVDIADMKAASHTPDWMTSYVLGSGVAIAIHDPEAKVSALLHFILPSSKLDRSRATNNPYLFLLIRGFPSFIAGLISWGRKKNGLYAGSPAARMFWIQNIRWILVRKITRLQGRYSRQTRRISQVNSWAESWG
jgi:hypothetical protein